MCIINSIKFNINKDKEQYKKLLTLYILNIQLIIHITHMIYRITDSSRTIDRMNIIHSLFFYTTVLN